MQYSYLAVAVCLAATQVQAGCSLSFTSPHNGATVRSAHITVTGAGGADAKEGDTGQVIATLNGQPIFRYAGSFRRAISFLEHRGVGVTLKPGNNFLQVNGSVGGCSASDAMTITFDKELIQAKNKGKPSNLSCQGNPINTAVGNKYQVETDYVSNAGASLDFVRFYNSLDGIWRHNYSTHLILSATSIRLVHADGRESVFSRTNNVVHDDKDEFGNLSYSNSQWSYISPNEDLFIFDSDGRLIRWQNINALGYQLTYTSDKTVAALLKNEWVVMYIYPPHSPQLKPPEDIHGRPFSDCAWHHCPLVY